MRSFNIVGDEISFEDALLNKVMEHSHLAIDVDLIDKVKEQINTSYGVLEKSKMENVESLKPKDDESHEEFLNQIAYLKSLITLVSNRKGIVVSFKSKLCEFARR